MDIAITKITKDVKERISIPIGNVEMHGELVIPGNATGLVLFSHGSGSSRFSPRNNMVARRLHTRGVGTLLFDLLASNEDMVYANRFDIDLLTERLVAATGWLMGRPEAKNLSIGYFGASTGAASALNAAAKFGHLIKAVVSRGGRPDLAMPVLNQVQAPVLLLVGELDSPVIELNRRAYNQLKCEKELKIISGATHLFEEPGKLEEVALLSARWFEKYL